ncbi:hypothetical protein [Nocardioides astragali]|uniref:PASTA domain-containing protein n=1 Tax=Nocardioides astragali TaxID=1776736 RepID=A0ABW2N5U8_9ACTN|nr:hypothetical protein [Nocardioides astragali]
MTLGAGCGGGELDALKSDPMATEPIEGLEEVDGSENEGSSGGVIGKPAPTQHQRIFAGSTDAEVERAFEEVLSMAEEVGWQVSSVSPLRDGFVAEREIDGHRSRLTVSVNRDPDLGPAPGLSISISTTVE